MTIKRSTLIEGILIICMVAILGLVTAIIVAQLSRQKSKIFIMN